MRKTTIIAATFALTAMAGQSAWAAQAHDNHSNKADHTDNSARSVSDWLFDGDVYGYARGMAFFKNFSGTNSQPHPRTYSVGGGVQYRSPELYGLSFGLGGYGAHDLGTVADGGEPDVPTDSFATLGKAFLRFQYKGLDVKGGRIGIDTPFANENAFRRMIPVTYQGFGGEYKLPFAENVSLAAYKVYKFKPYGSAHFTDSDAGNDLVAATDVPSVESNGFYTAGIKYEKRFGPKAQAWYYHFDKRAQMLYAGGQYPVSALRFGGVTPFVGAQYLHESDVSDAAPGFENVHTNLYSARLGFSTRNHTFYVADTYVPVNRGAFRNGGYYTPYQHESYNNSPLADGQPLKSMATAAQPGNVISVRYIYHGGKGFKTVLGYTHLDLKDSGANPWGSDADKVNAGFLILSYDYTKRLNLSLETDYVSSHDKFTGNYNAERFYVTYRFGKLKPDFDY